MGARIVKTSEIGRQMARKQITVADIVGWQVTSQAVDQVTTDDAGNIVRGALVRFVTQGGAHGSIFVPDIYYNARTVHQMIAAKAAIIDEIGNLAHDSFLLGE